MSNRRLEQRLKEALPELPPDARKIIVRRLEQKKARAADNQDFDEVLELIRKHDLEKNSFPKRIPTPARLFFNGLEPFLWDLPDIFKQRGRIPRSALTPVWGWLVDILPTDALLSQVERAKFRLAADQIKDAEQLILKARAKALPLIRTMLAEYRTRPKRWTEVGVGIDRPHTLDHVADMVDILENLSVLEKVQCKSPQSGDAERNPFKIDECILEDLPENARDLAYAKVAGQIGNPVVFAAHYNDAVSFDAESGQPGHPAIAVIDIATAEAMLCASDLVRLIESGDCSSKAGTLMKRISTAVAFLTRLRNHPGRPWRGKLAEPLSKLDDVLIEVFKTVLHDIEAAFAPCHDLQLVVGPDMDRMKVLTRWGRFMKVCETSFELPKSSKQLPDIKRQAMGVLERVNAAIVKNMIVDKDNRNVHRFFDCAIKVTGAIHGPKLATAWRNAGLQAVNGVPKRDASEAEPEVGDNGVKIYLS